VKVGACRSASARRDRRESCAKSNEQGRGFYVTGEFIELVPYTKIVHVERMHLPDPTPENLVETTFIDDAKGTLMTVRMTPDGIDASRGVPQ
jgi:uncharacterized protein YndB with AHSA1/START domain